MYGLWVSLESKIIGFRHLNHRTKHNRVIESVPAQALACIYNQTYFYNSHLSFCPQYNHSADYSTDRFFPDGERTRPLAPTAPRW